MCFPVNFAKFLKHFFTEHLLASAWSKNGDINNSDVIKYLTLTVAINE